jgi:hypothetical protein
MDKGFMVLANNEIVRHRAILCALFPFISTHKHQQALVVFTKLGEYGIVEQLLHSRGCNPKAAHVLVWATKREDLRLVRLLVDYDDDPNALLFACQFGYYHITKFLLSKLNYEHENGRCFLLACLFHQTKIVTLLLQNAYFRTPNTLDGGLRNAVFYGYTDLVHELLQAHVPQRDILIEMLNIGAKHTSIVEMIQNILNKTL